MKLISWLIGISAAMFSLTCDQVLVSFRLVKPFVRKRETKNRA